MGSLNDHKAAAMALALGGGGSLASVADREAAYWAGILDGSIGGGGGGLTSEQVRDLVATFLVAGSNITLTHDDPGDTLTVASTAAGGGFTQEQIEDMVGAMIQDNSALDWTYDDASSALTALLKTQPGGLLAQRTTVPANAGQTSVAATDVVIGIGTLSFTALDTTAIVRVQVRISTAAAAQTLTMGIWDSVAVALFAGGTYHTASAGTASGTVSSFVGTWTLSGLTPGNSYTIELRASKTVGTGAVSVLHNDGLYMFEVRRPFP